MIKVILGILAVFVAGAIFLTMSLLPLFEDMLRAYEKDEANA